MRDARRLHASRLSFFVLHVSQLSNTTFKLEKQAARRSVITTATGLAGFVSNTQSADCDCEQGDPARPPQGRTVVPGADRVRVENSFRRFLHGLNPRQRAQVKARMRRDGDVMLGIAR